MSGQTVPEHDNEATVYEPTHEQWRAARERALAAAGLTYDELTEQARTRSFQSAEALNLWITFGDAAA